MKLEIMCNLFWNHCLVYFTLHTVIDASSTEKSSTLIEDLILGYTTIGSSQTTFSLSRPESTSFESCMISITNNSLIWKLEPTTVINNTFVVSTLSPATKYQIKLECTDKQNDKHSSPIVSFETVAAGQPTYSVPKNEFHHPLSDGDLEGISNGPPVTKEKISTASSPMDLALGIILGMIGMAILCTASFYLLRKYRRQRRIQRLLQYRQQDSDPFSDAEDDGDLSQ